MHEQDEALYILEGEIALAVGSEKMRVKADSLAYVPARCVHSFRVMSDQVRLLNFYLPGGFERVIMETGVPAEASSFESQRVMPETEVESTRMLIPAHSSRTHSPFTSEFEKTSSTEAS